MSLRVPPLPPLAVTVAVLVATALLVASTAAHAQVPIQVLHNFSGYDFSEGPSAELIQATDGNFYGTTRRGGHLNRGTVFRMTPSGGVTVLHSFAGGNGDGAIPDAALLQGADGKLYGTTVNGGTHDAGTIFRMGLQGDFEILHSFSGGSDDGANPGGLIQTEDGSFYGTTARGGTSDRGTAFRMTPDGSVVVLHSFGGGPPNGEIPSTLVQASDGNFYGTTYYGGTSPPCGYACGNGTIFRMTVDGAVTILRSFHGDDGANPHAPLIQASDGNLYGTTTFGGSTTYANGVVFRMALDGAFTVLHVFNYDVDGSHPAGSLLEGTDGGIYGTFEFGDAGRGGVFRISAAGAFAVLHVFPGGRDGDSPGGGLIQSSDGAFYGGTLHGGYSNFGTLYRMTANGAVTTLYQFAGSPEGHSPSAGLLRASDGNFYGTTYAGGRFNKGTIFRVTPTGRHSLVYTFTGRLDGKSPSGGLVQGRDGHLYGTTPVGGAYDSGTVFRVTLAGKFKTLHAFTGNAEGDSPNGIILARDGNFYGTTDRSRTGINQGTIFRMMPDGHFDVVHTFKAVRDGTRPFAGLLQASDGNFYGMTSQGGRTFPDAGDGAGTVFRLTPGGAYTVLHRFDVDAEGKGPNTSLVQGSDGNLYGHTGCGVPRADGTTDGGAFFRMSLAGAFRVLTRNGLECSSDLGPPSIFLSRGPDGIFYGTMFGTVFELTYAGSSTTLCDAATCRAYFPVTLGTNGYLYGVGFRGADRAGQVLRLTPVAARPPRVTVSMRSDGGVRLTWQASGNATSYRVKRGLVGGSAVQIASNIRSTSFTDTHAVPGKTYYYIVTAVNALGESLNSYEVSITAGRATLGDFEGDRRADLGVYRPSNGTWYARFSSANFSDTSWAAYQWGLPGDVPISGDFDGDGRMDLTVFRPSNGVWYVRFSSSDSWTPYQWGLPGDVPLGADMDGDGRTDLVVYRPTTAVWYVRFSSDDYSLSTYQAHQWGLVGDVPMVGDFDGDGKADLVVFRPSNGTWYVRFSSDDYSWSTWQAYWPEEYVDWVPWDVPVAGDFDGDGKTDLATFRPDTGIWRVRHSSNNYSLAAKVYQWGWIGDVPLAIDTDGDGQAEVTVFRPSTGKWFIRYSASEYTDDPWTSYQWGLPGDTPLP